MSNYIYDLPTSGEFYDILKNTIAPNLTFTQCNLFECLEQIFMYLDGYPVLTKENVLDIRYFNDNNGEIVETKESDAKIAMSEQRYVNGFITDFQNASLNNVLTYPTKKTYSNVQSKEIGIVDNTDNYIMRVDNSIYNLRSVKVYVNSFTLKVQSYSGSITTHDTFSITYNKLIDITENVIAQDLYVNLDNIDPITSVYVDDIPLVKQNCLVFSQKEKYINVGTTYKKFVTNDYVMPSVIKSSIRKMFGVYRQADIYTMNEVGVTPDFQKVYEQVKYQIEYETLSNGRLLIEGLENKFNGAERLDIGQGASDIMKTGLNLLGMSVKTGVDTLVRTEKFSKSENRIKVGSLYYENGERYIATKVDECVFGDFVFSTIQYTKNFNKLSQFISLDQKKRFNEVDSSLTLRSEDVYKEYLYFSFDEPTSSAVTSIHLYATFMQSCIEDTFRLTPNNKYCIDYCSCSTMNYDGTSNEKFGNIWLPLLQYGSGNALCYEVAFNSPISANSNFKHDDTLNAWYSKYILYTSDDGFADTINIDFYHQLNEISTDNLPQVDDNLIANSAKYGAFQSLNYYKKPNETFAMNYELICLPYENQEIYIGEKFIKYNGLIANAINKKELRLFISDSKKYSILDKYALGDKQDGTFSVNVNYVYSSVGRMALKLQIYKGSSIYQLNKKIVSWAICDEDNNILISANQDLLINDNLTFYIFTSHSRL